jgi:hypothetical protein
MAAPIPAIIASMVGISIGLCVGINAWHHDDLWCRSWKIWKDEFFFSEKLASRNFGFVNVCTMVHT